MPKRRRGLQESYLPMGEHGRELCGRGCYTPAWSGRMAAWGVRHSPILQNELFTKKERTEK